MAKTFIKGLAILTSQLYSIQIVISQMNTLLENSIHLCLEMELLC